MKITDLLTEPSIAVNFQPTTKDELLNSVVNLLEHEIDSTLLEEIRSAVFEREAIMSTGVGKGLAIPHAKVKGLTQNYAAFARLSTGVDFDSIDGKPVDMLFLIVGPHTQSSQHIKLLSRISRLMNNDDFRIRLLSAQNQSEVIRIFKEEEGKYFAS